MYAGSLSAAFKMAIEAGNDIVISSTTARLGENLWTSNLSSMKTDENFKSRVKDAAFRVIKAKLEYFKGENAAPLYPEASEISKFIPDKEGDKFFLQQACRSITYYKKSEEKLTQAKAGRVLLCGSLPQFFTEGKKRYPNSGEFKFNYELGPNETAWMSENILKIYDSYDTIVFLVANQRSAKIAEQLKGKGKKVVIFSIMTPTYSFGLDWADEILLGYSWSGYTLEAMFGALDGEFEAEGILPFKN